MSDLQDCWKSKQEGFAAAADMIGKLLTAWEESQTEVSALRALLGRAREALGEAIEWGIWTTGGVDRVLMDHERTAFLENFHKQREVLQSKLAAFDAALRGAGENDAASGNTVADESHSALPGPATQAATPAPSDHAEIERCPIGCDALAVTEADLLRLAEIAVGNALGAELRSMVAARALARWREGR